MTNTVPIKSVSAGEIAKHSVDNWVFNYCPPTDLIGKNIKQFTFKFFFDVCRILKVHNSFTTTYHPQIKGQVERFNGTILAALRAYITDHLQDWYLYISALTSAYNTKLQSSTSIAPFCVVLSKPLGPIAASLPPTYIQSTPRFQTQMEEMASEGDPSDKGEAAKCPGTI